MKAIDIPRNPAQRRAWISYQLRLHGLTLGRLAERLKVHRSTPVTALKRPYPRMERAIADALGLQPQQIWPERYDASGATLHPRGGWRKRRASAAEVSAASRRARNGSAHGAGRRSAERAP